MNIKIKCNDEFITHILDENYKEIREEKSNSFNVFLDRDYFIYFSILDKKSEIIRLSNLLTSLEVNYLDDKEKLEVNINSENYGEVKVIKLKDEKNLFFREDKEKVINILLPFNYDKNKKYGLILMFDSQNIYDINKVGKYTLLNDPYGGWQVDSTLSIVKEKYGKEYIVVGIEDADKYRATELTPSSKIYKFKEILKDLDEESLRKNISIIRQEPFIFNKTIRENFKLIDKDITLKDAYTKKDIKVTLNVLYILFLVFILFE